MSSAAEISLHPSLSLIFPDENLPDEDIDADAAWHFYSHSIRRNPADLTLHTHRVFFAMNHRNATLLPGSLHDLFYVLKDAGENLRVRLLKASIPYLSEKDVLYFAMWIKTGIKNGMGYQWVNGSVLSDGLFGPDQELITLNSEESGDQGMSSLEEARACMEYGQLDVAQDILLKALEEDPDNTLLLEELDYLNSYAKSREIHPEKEAKTKKFESVLSRLKKKIFS